MSAEDTKAQEAAAEPETVVETSGTTSQAADQPTTTADDEDSEDSLTFSNGVIEKIVAIAMHSVPGVVGMKGNWFNSVQEAVGVRDSTKGVSVEVTPDSAVRVNVSVLIEYGAYAPQVFDDAKSAVVKAVGDMTGLEVAGVNLRIEDVLTKEEIARRNGEGAPAARPALAAEAADAEAAAE